MSDALAEPLTVQNPMIHVPTIVEPDTDADERGRLKRRRQSSHSPRRALSPSRGHDRDSGSRYQGHHRKHHRPSSSSSISPPPSVQKKTRRRSDAEPDHTFRGRARKRSIDRARTQSSLIEDEDVFLESDEEVKKFTKRSAPPSRHRVDEEDLAAELRRQRSYPNLYKVDRRDSKSESEKHPQGVVGTVDSTQAAVTPHTNDGQRH